MTDTAIVRQEPGLPQKNGTGASVPPVRVTTDITLTELGNALAKSGYFKDAPDAAKAIVKVLYGQELGIGPIASMMGIHIIEGKPAPSSNLLAAMVRRSGVYGYRVVEHTAEACELLPLERGQACGPAVRWTIQDATRAGLAGKNTWKSYPRQMLFSRAISELVRTYFPDLFGGAPVYTPEELGAEVNAETGEPVRLMAAITDGQTAVGFDRETGQPRQVSRTTGEVAESVVSATETGASFGSEAISGTDLKSLQRRYAEEYMKATGEVLKGPGAKVAFSNYTKRALGRDVETKDLTADDIHELLRELSGLTDLRKRGFALYSKSGADPNNLDGETMRLDMGRVLGVAIDTRRLVTPREWRKWNEKLEEQIEPPLAEAPSEPSDNPFDEEG